MATVVVRAVAAVLATHAVKDETETGAGRWRRTKTKTGKTKTETGTEWWRQAVVAVAMQATTPDTYR